MGIGTRIGRPWKAMLPLAVGGAGGAAAVAVATVPDGNGAIRACVSVSTQNGTIVPSTFAAIPTIIDPSAGQHCIPDDGTIKNQTTLTWNSTGPQSQPGIAGPPGKSATIVSGQTLTLAGGNVVTVGGGTGRTFTVTGPPTRPSGRQLTLRIDSMSLPILAFSFFNGGGASTDTARAAKVIVHDISITKKLDKGSASLAKSCATGKHFQTATITVRKSSGGKQQFLTYKLSNVIISSYQTGGSGRNATPTETITLNFTKEQIEYTK